ncbi:MAG: lysophospholipid acyltransferase family protein [Acidobacteriia bacterium]|nr:lysophospholipid acyltransferase family protein [Terriglobia bacterium]
MADSQEKSTAAHDEQQAARAPEGGVALQENLRTFTLWQRLQIFLASWIGYLAVLLIGRTLRLEVYGWENWEAARKTGKGLIYTFWHREIFPATWFWRRRGIVVMTSQNFDGEYIARIIQRHGFGAARGSSSRGAYRALGEMVRCLRHGADTAFTIDGPRGPRFVAKPGAVLLAKATGAAILCFHIALRKAYVFRKTWDQTQIPCPFGRAAVFIAPPILVSPEANEEEQTRKHQEVQAALDQLRERGEAWAGSA